MKRICYEVMFVLLLSFSQISTTFATQFPIKGDVNNLIGFGFGQYNSVFGGYHLGLDTKIDLTPTETKVYSPCSGIVRISDNISSRGYGSNSTNNPNYRGYVLVIEENTGKFRTWLLGHIQAGSNNYNASSEIGLAPIGTIVREGQYVARVANYWNGADYSSNWHHLHIGVRNGAYTSGHDSDYVTGYSNSGWNSDYSTHSQWLNPYTIFQQEASTYTCHLPNGLYVVGKGGGTYYYIQDGKKRPINGGYLAGRKITSDRVVALSDDTLNSIPTGDIVKSYQEYRGFKFSGNSYYKLSLFNLLIRINKLDNDNI